MLTTTSPENAPRAGTMPSTAGAASNKNASPLRAVPAGVVTRTSTRPGAPTPVVQLSSLVLTTVTSAQATPPRVTVVAPSTKPAPLTVITVPPAASPLFGLTAVMRMRSA